MVGKKIETKPLTLGDLAESATLLAEVDDDSDATTLSTSGGLLDSVDLEGNINRSAPSAHENRETKKVRGDAQGTAGKCRCRSRRHPNRCTHRERGP